MEVKERVERIKAYFVTLSVTEEAICVVTHFPNEWHMADTKLLRDRFKCEIADKDGCVFFMTELENGFDTAFDCVDFIINMNREIIEKQTLLKAKAKELSELFAKEPLDRLKTLYFAFDDSSLKKRGGKKAAKKETVVPVPEPVAETEEVVPESTFPEEAEENNEPDEEVSSLLATAMKMTGE